MHIVSSNVSLFSNNINYSSVIIKEHLRKWDRNNEILYELEKNDNIIKKESLQKKDIVDITHDFVKKEHINSKKINHLTNEKESFLQKIDEKFITNLKTQVIKEIIEKLTGKKIEIFDPKQVKEARVDEELNNISQLQNINKDNSGSQLEGWGIDYFYQEIHYTKESVEFAGSGAVKTSDGKEIYFNVQLIMSRERYDELSISFKAGDALKDPLLINLENIEPLFLNVKFEFDIDGDGKNEKLNTPVKGIGFIGYDRNGNGIIDNGLELFGPSTGNGFNELLELDEDGNGWIDQKDSTFSKLKIWEKDSSGADIISTLTEKGIGALYTGRASTLYNITTDKKLVALLKESGLYLRESGNVGFIHEVDFIV